MRARTKDTLRWILHGLLGVAGIVAMVILVRHVGTAALRETLGTLFAWIPLVFLLEGARITADAWRTRLLYAAAGQSIAWRVVLGAQLRAYPFGLFLPAGGAASEAYKATVLAAVVPPPLAAAVASHNQSLVLFGGFIVSIPCFAVSYAVWGPHPMTIAVGVQALSGIGLGLGIVLVTRVRLLTRVVTFVSKRAGAAVLSYQKAVVGLPAVPLRPIGAAVVSRLTQLGQVTVLGFGVGVALGAATPLLVYGPHLVGTAAGDLVPGQIGALDGAFALGADALGVSRGAALSIPIVLHVVQIAWGIVGIVSGIVARRRATHAVETTRAGAE